MIYRLSGRLLCGLFLSLLSTVGSPPSFESENDKRKEMVASQEGKRGEVRHTEWGERGETSFWYGWLAGWLGLDYDYTVPAVKMVQFGVVTATTKVQGHIHTRTTRGNKISQHVKKPNIFYFAITLFIYNYVAKVVQKCSV